MVKAARTTAKKLRDVAASMSRQADHLPSEMWRYVEQVGRVAARSLDGFALGNKISEIGAEAARSAKHALDDVEPAILREAERLEDLASDNRRATHTDNIAQAALIGRASPSFPRVESVEVDELTTLFNAYGDDNSHGPRWTGSDSNYSLVMPHQSDSGNPRILWLCSDALYGTVNPDGSRPPFATEDGGTTWLPYNMFVVQDGDRFESIVGGTPDEPRGIVEPRSREERYWFGEGLAVGDEIQIIYRRYRTWEMSLGSTVVRFDPDNLTQPLEAVERKIFGGVSYEIAWGSALLRTDDFTYIYGTDGTPWGTFLRIARVEGENLMGQWEYLTGDGRWSTEQENLTRVLEGVATEFSVSRLGDRYVLITHDTPQMVSPNIVGYVADSPAGPFEEKTVLYTTPENARDPSLYTYCSHAHPHIDRGENRLLISYNVHSLAPRDMKTSREWNVFQDVSIYRPRFITIEFAD